MRLEQGNLLNLGHYLVVCGDGPELPVEPSQVVELITQDRENFRVDLPGGVETETKLRPIALVRASGLSVF
jgi:hypothetical protein